MNEQTTKLIEQLSQQLGTTTEYLWSALLKQATVSAATDILSLMLVIIFGILLWKLHKYLSKGKGEYNYSTYEDLEEVVIIPMVIWGIWAFICLCSIGNIINGFINPEYWALKEILDAVIN